MVIISCILIAGTLYLASASKSEPVPIRRPLSELPGRIGNWVLERSTELDQETLSVLGVDDYTNRLYIGRDGASAGLYLGYYVSQSQGNTIHSPLNCLPGAGWNPIQKTIITVPVRQGSEPNGSNSPQSGIRINCITIEKGLDKQIVLYWYQSHGRVVASEYWGKIYTVLDAIRTNRTDAALVRVICSVRGTEKKAEIQAQQDALDFVKCLYPLLDQYLPY
jgi:EpsI family protein